MKAIRRLRMAVSGPRRLARSHGFGIHSPWAYDFVRRVVSQPCAYYDYRRLDKAAREFGASSRAVRLVFRVALHLRPNSYAVGPMRGAEAIIEAIRRGAPKAFLSDLPEMAVIEAAENAPIGALAAVLRRGGVVVILRNSRYPATAERLWMQSCPGIAFRGSRMAIFVGRRELSRQQYNVWL